MILLEKQDGEVSKAARIPHFLDPTPLCLIGTLCNRKYDTRLLH